MRKTKNYKILKVFCKHKLNNFKFIKKTAKQNSKMKNPRIK